MVEVLGEVVVLQCGAFKKVRRYLRGVHPERGRITLGYTGLETIEEKDLVIPIAVFNVSEQDAKMLTLQASFVQ